MREYGLDLKWLAVSSFEMRFGETTVLAYPPIYCDIKFVWQILSSTILQICKRDLLEKTKTGRDVARPVFIILNTRISGESTVYGKNNTGDEAGCSIIEEEE